MVAPSVKLHLCAYVLCNCSSLQLRLTFLKIAVEFTKCMWMKMCACTANFHMILDCLIKFIIYRMKFHGPAHGIVTKTVHKSLAGVGEVKGCGGPGGG